MQTRCFCNVHDVVAALIGLVESPAAIGEVFNVGSTDEVTILSLAQHILALTDRSPEDIVLVPYAKAYEPGFEDMRRRVPDIGKIRRTTGWEPTIALDETLRQVIEGEKAKKQRSE